MESEDLLVEGAGLFEILNFDCDVYEVGHGFLLQGFKRTVERFYDALHPPAGGLPQRHPPYAPRNQPQGREYSQLKPSFSLFATISPAGQAGNREVFCENSPSSRSEGLDPQSLTACVSTHLFMANGEWRLNEY